MYQKSVEEVGSIDSNFAYPMTSEDVLKRFAKVLSNV